ncbi:MAG: restriction endonuclease [Pyrinomonadaceae bacterium]
MDVIFKIPEESPDYAAHSAFVIEQIAAIMKDSIDGGRNKIFIHTNLKRGLPLENINKVAGPFVEAWAVEQFENITDNTNNIYQLINVEAGTRLSKFDIILQFRIGNKTDYVSADIDVKATAEDIVKSGKSPNITSYARIRSEYVADPDFIFIILSLKHRVYGEKQDTGMTNGIMEVVSHSVYDIKFISARDLNYNPSLGTGQLQIRDIHYVDLEQRTAWEFCQLLDAKFIRSKGEAAWLAMAEKQGWIKIDD